MAESPPTLPSRLPLIDVLRGVAILAMVVYHFSWDLAYHGLVGWDVTGAPAWRAFAMAIAGSFLLLSGIGLALAARDGLDLAKALRRIGKIGAAALLVSLATMAAFDAGWIYFGILHAIALGSLLALPFSSRSAAAALAAATAIGLAFLVLGGRLPNWPLLWPLGLSPDPAPANDYVPLFPWLAAMLVGVGLGRMILAGAIRLPAVGQRGMSARGLALIGRWSLAIYLVHQPVLFTAVGQAARLIPPDAAIERQRFIAACVPGCAANGGLEAACSAFCGCVASAMDGTGFWSVRGGDPALASVMATAATTCQGAETFDPAGPPEARPR